MKNVKLLLLMSFLFLTEIGFSQNTVTYSTLSKTIDLNSGSEGTVDVVVNCYGSSSAPVFLNATQSCGNNDGILSTTYTNGSVLAPGQNTTIRYKFKKTVTTNTQITYKFSTNGSCFQNESGMIKITVNYKAGSTTTPVIPPELIYIGSWPTTNATITEGSVAPLMSGTGVGNYTFQWYKTINGVFTLIPGATSYYYYPEALSVTTKYRRQNILGSVIGVSNEITITVVPAPIIQNNTITLDGVIVSGSLPTGGIGSYTYSWYILDDGERTDLNEKSQSFQLFTPSFDKYFDSSHNLTITRLVTSGNQITASNRIEIPYVEATPLLNNTITLNGNIVSGSLPTGGRGSYLYSWYILDDGERTDLNETTQSYELFTPSFNKYFDSSHNLTITRLVTAGNQITASNRIEIPNNSSKATAKQENTLTSVVYPNPTSGSVNFMTSFPSDKEIEIIVYSEAFEKTQSVFKGIVTANQIVTWNIPSNHPKGIYFYKIVSGNEEIKSGKIIFQ